MSVLMGANIASDVAHEDFCESTIGCTSEEQGKLLQTLFNKPYFRVNVVKDVAAVELCGALKVCVFVCLHVGVCASVCFVYVCMFAHLFVCLF